jgi:hypothetical protein
MAKRGGSKALARRGGTSVVVVRSGSPAKAKKKGGGRRKGGGGGSGVTTTRKKMFIFGGGAVYGRLRSEAKKKPNEGVGAILNKVPVIKELGATLTHGVLVTWLLVPNVPAGFWREAVDGAACAMIGKGGIDLGMSDFDTSKMAALGADDNVMSAAQVRERYNIEGE